MLLRQASLKRSSGVKVPSMCRWSSSFGRAVMKGEGGRADFRFPLLEEGVGYSFHWEWTWWKV
jgi:hypothetical protein